MQKTEYPAQLTIDYPEGPLNRATTAFRLFMALPILIVLATVSGTNWQWNSTNGSTTAAAGTAAGAGGLLFLGPLLLILFRRKYPRW